MNKKILYFLLINFAITWGAWITVIGINQDVPLQLGQFSYILYGIGGLLGPVVTAILARGVWGEKGEVKALLKQTIHVRVHIGWYVFSMLVPFVLIITPSLLHLIFTGEFHLQFNQPLFLIFLTRGYKCGKIQLRVAPRVFKRDELEGLKPETLVLIGEQEVVYSSTKKAVEYPNSFSNKKQN